uniref:Neural proliferation, differentiation and control 1 n=1 Tax=Otus sunia TaxID=257818 RepID=A0A8C8E630_9STRI
MRGAGRAASCPRSLDCALQRRQFCPPGSGACGPCLPTFQEDARGRCVQKQLSASGRCTHPAAAPSATSHLQTCPAPQQLQELPTPQGSPPQQHPCSPSSGFSPRQPGPCGAGSSAPSHPKPQPAAAVWFWAGREHADPTPRLVHPPAAALVTVCATDPASTQRCPGARGPWWLLQKEVRLAQKADYSTQRAASPLPYDKISPGDKTLAQSAQMYHYQHQKQQMLSMEKHKEEPKLPDSASSDEENEDGDFTVYECPGLAPTGEMEVRNPLFDDSSLHPSNPKSHQ